MATRRGLQRFVTLLLVFAMLAPPFGNGAAAAGDRDLTLPAIPRVPSGDDMLLFGKIEKETKDGYRITTAPVEISYRDQTYQHEQALSRFDVKIGANTEVVTEAGKAKLMPGDPVVVAGYRKSGYVEAVVIGSINAAIPLETQEQPDSGKTDAVAEKIGLQQQLAAAPGAADGDLPSPNAPHVISRYTTVSGQYDSGVKGHKELPTWKIGVLELTVYFEYFAGVSANWDWPLKIDTTLHNPLRYYSYADRFPLPGETSEDRYKRLDKQRALLTLNYYPVKPKDARSFFGEIGARVSVGFKGKALGKTFDEKIDITRVLASAAGGIAPNMQVGGKKAPPLWGETETYGVKDKIAIDKDSIDCGVMSCTVDFFSEDAIGISIPFFDVKMISMGFVFTPLVKVLGDMPRIKRVRATNGLQAEVIQGYRNQGNANPPVPIDDHMVIWPYDALSLYLTDTVTAGKVEPPKALEEGAKLTFEVDYDPEATFGMLIQATVSAKKLGIGGEVKLPWGVLEIPLKVKLDSDGDGALSCVDINGDGVVRNYGCGKGDNDGAIVFDPASIVMPQKLVTASDPPVPVASLPLALSGSPYQAGPYRVIDGAGLPRVKPVGALPGGLNFSYNGVHMNLTGNVNLKEGRYPIRISSKDISGIERIFDLALDVVGVYPKAANSVLLEGQSWNRQFRLMGADGQPRTQGVTWRFSGNLPEQSYTFDEQTGRLSISSAPVGQYFYFVDPIIDGVPYPTEQSHGLKVTKRAFSPDYRWQDRQQTTFNKLDVELYRMELGSAAWHDGLGALAVMTQRGLYTLSGDRFSKTGLPKPAYGIRPTLAFVDPPGQSEGWMYAFGGRKDVSIDEWTSDLYRWDKTGGWRLLHQDRKDGNSPALFDAPAAASSDGTLLIHGGAADTYGKATDATWLYDPGSNSFEKLNVPVHPGKRHGNDAMAYIPELNKALLFGGQYGNSAFATPDRRMWLFDYAAKSWSALGEAYEIDLANDEDTQLVYARSERKLYVLITSTDPAKPPRMYSISASAGGGLGPLMNETGALPADSSAWKPDGGLFTYDEQKGRLLYLTNEGGLEGSLYAYQLPEADKDRPSIAANGQDTASVAFNVKRYTDKPADWDFVWRPIGDITLIGGDQPAVPDAAGNVTVQVSHSNLSYTEPKQANLMLYARYKGANPVLQGADVPVARASVELLPVPPDAANSYIRLSPDTLDDRGDVAWNARIDDTATVTIGIRDGGAGGGQPLPGRKIKLRNADELIRHFLYLSPGTAFDPERYVDASTVLTTDAQGLVTLTLKNNPPGASVGEYPLQFELLDGSGLVVQHSMTIRPLELIPKKSVYGFKGRAGELLTTMPGAAKNGIELANATSWNPFNCKNGTLSACFEVTGGSLPPGIYLNTFTGDFGGIPTEAGYFEAKIRLPNGIRTVSAVFEIEQPLKLEQAYAYWEQPGIVGEPYQHETLLRVKGGNRPFTFAVDTSMGDPLPPGLTLHPETGVISGKFAAAGHYRTSVKITDGSALGPQTVWKTYLFTVEEPRYVGTAFNSFGKLRVDSTARLWASQLEGIPAGSADGVFEPWEGGAYYELKRPDTTGAVPFTIEVDAGRDEWLRMYFWNAASQAWEPFSDQSVEPTDNGMRNVLKVSIRQNGPDNNKELIGAWERGEGLFRLGYYDRLLLAVGGAAPGQPRITGLDMEEDPDGFDRLTVTGDNFTADSRVYIGAREGLGATAFWSSDLQQWQVVTRVPPGEGKHPVYVVTRGGMSEPDPAFTYEYPPDMRIPVDQLRLKLSLITSETDPAYPLLTKSEAIAVVQLADWAGNPLKLSQAGPGFDPNVRIQYWANDYSVLKLVCTPESANCQDTYREGEGVELQGTLNADGQFRATLLIGDPNPSDCEETECEPGEEPLPGDGSEVQEGFPVDLSVSTGDGHYARLTTEASPHLPETAPTVDSLDIATEALPEGSENAPYYAKLEAHGSRVGPYLWYWAGDSDIPPGLVLDPATGELRDPSAEEIAQGLYDADEKKQPGTYAVSVLLTDGVIRTTKSFTLTIHGAPDNPLQLKGLQLRLDIGGVPVVMDAVAGADEHSFVATVPFDAGQVEVAASVSEAVYGIHLQHQGRSAALLPDAFRNVKLEPGLNRMNVVLSGDDPANPANRVYNLAVNRSYTASIRSVSVTDETGKELAAVPIQQGQSAYAVKVPYGTASVALSATAADSRATVKIAGVETGSGRRSSMLPLDGNSLVVPVEGIALDNSSSTRYEIHIEREASTDPRLSGLTMNPGRFNEAFAPDRYAYTASVDSGVSKADLRPAAVAADAEIRVDVNGEQVQATSGAYELPLRVGANEVSIVVTAAGLASAEYRLSITRAGQGPNPDPGTDPNPQPGTDPNPQPGQEEDHPDSPHRFQMGDAFSIVIRGLVLSGSERIAGSSGTVPSPSAPALLPLSRGYRVGVSPSRSIKDKLEADIRLKLESIVLPKGYKPSLFVYDEAEGQWKELGGTVQDGWLAGKSDRLGWYAVYAVPDGSVAAIAFRDIVGHWAQRWIELGHALGLASGYPDGTMRPDRQISRLEFGAMLMNLLQEKPKELEGAPQPSDWARIPAWGRPIVLALMHGGIVAGYEDGTFRPGNAIKRLEAMAMLAQALKLPPGDPAVLDRFADRDAVPRWAVGAVAALIKEGYVTGRDGNRLAAAETITRAEAMTLLVKVIQKLRYTF